MAFGEIYKYTWWGKVVTGGFGAIYQALISLVGTLLSALNNRAENYENNTATDAILVPLENSGLLEKASIVLTPTAYGDGVINAIEPQNGDGDFDFVRATTATRVNALGLIEEVAAGIPRIDYSSGVGQWLFEPLRKNEIIYSSDIDSWSKTNAPTITTNIFTAPDGTLTADGIQNEDALNQKYISYAVGGSVSANSTYTASLFIKKETSETGYGGIGLTYTGGTYKYARAAINAVNGTANSLSGSTITPTIKMIDFDSNWWKIEMTATDNGSNTALTFFYFAHISSDFTTSNTTGVSSVRTIWGAQLEEGSYATSYIPTSGTTKTRNADVANNSGNADLFNDSEGVLYAEIAALANDGTNRYISINNGGISNFIGVFYDSNANRISYTGYDGNVFMFSMYNTLNNSLNQNKIAVKYKANDFALWVNGIERVTSTSYSSTPSGFKEIDFNIGNGSNPFYGNTKELMYFPEALTDLELETVTSWSSFELMAADLEYEV